MAAAILAANMVANFRLKGPMLCVRNANQLDTEHQTNWALPPTILGSGTEWIGACASLLGISQLTGNDPIANV